jgi:mannose/cellobiose epimerase-like protein (N-acyl-D-glucosamine 2-epimerase family)
MGLRTAIQTTTVAGQVTSIDPENRSFTITCRSGDVVDAFVGETTIFEVLSNVDGVSHDRTVMPEDNGAVTDPVGRQLVRYLVQDALIFARGLNMEHEGRHRFEARIVYLLHSQPGERYVFEQSHWWLTQITRLADRWLDQLFDATRNYSLEDFAKFYRTNLNILGGGTDDRTQECATLSRLIYGLSSAYLLTGAERYFLAASAAVAYQRQAFRSLSSGGRHCFWAHGRRATSAGERLLMASEFPDDAGTIPLYEQIYALAGLAQYYRITADWEVLEDIYRTVNAFEDYFHDDVEAKRRGLPGLGGYFSHLDLVTLRPDTPALGPNRLKKNWNSIGDHIPAYLVNLVLALDPLPHGTGRIAFERLQERAIAMLDETVTLIVEKFPDDSSDYVNERFHADWTPDHEYRWQQNRAIVGHNLKIAWNLTRCAFYLQHRERDMADRGQREAADRLRQLATRCMVLARRLGDKMAEVGVDRVRGGVFDAVEREPNNGMPTQFVWGATKDFWQQEQGILAYLILHGATGEPRYLDLARECMAFWNLFFLDREQQGIFFRTTEAGLPDLRGIYGQKGSHSVAGYHAFELNYLAHLYLRSYVPNGEHSRNFCLYFRVVGNREQRSINVLPDFVPPNRIEIKRVVANGVDRTQDLKPEGADDFQIRISELSPNLRDGSISLVVEFGVH